MRILDNTAKEVIGEIPKLVQIANRIAEAYQRAPEEMIPPDAINGTILAEYDRPGRTRKGWRVSVAAIFPNELSRCLAWFTRGVDKEWVGTRCDLTDAEWATFVADVDHALRVEQQQTEAQR